MRRTGIARAALAPLERRFALQFVQGAVLTSSNSVAAAVLNQEAAVCRCGCASSSAPGGRQGARGRLVGINGRRECSLPFCLDNRGVAASA